jgi:hypothetical protein
MIVSWTCHRESLIPAHSSRPGGATVRRGGARPRRDVRDRLQQRVHVDRLTPPLTAVSLPLHQIGELSARALLFAIVDDSPEGGATAQWAPIVSRLCAIRGVAALTGLGLAVEVGDWDRFTGSSIGAYLGLVPSDSSSGASRNQGPITKTRNTHARALLVEAAWQHARPLRAPGKALATRRAGLSPAVRARGQAADRRLHRRWTTMQARQKRPRSSRSPPPGDWPAGAGAWPPARLTGSTGQPQSPQTRCRPRAGLAPQDRPQRPRSSADSVPSASVLALTDMPLSIARSITSDGARIPTLNSTAKPSDHPARRRYTQTAHRRSWPTIPSQTHPGPHRAITRPTARHPNRATRCGSQWLGRGCGVASLKVVCDGRAGRRTQPGSTVDHGGVSVP